MLSFDAFATHVADGVKNQLWKGNSGILAILAGCTLKHEHYGRLHEQTIQSNLEKMLDKVCIKYC